MMSVTDADVFSAEGERFYRKNRKWHLGQLIRSYKLSLSEPSVRLRSPEAPFPVSPDVYNRPVLYTCTE